MKCAKPFRRGVEAFGCGQCLPCRVNRRRVLTARLVLESFQHEASCFATFTYSDKEVPSDGSVSVREAQLLLKRIRHFNPGRVRYYIVGEYGEQSLRPHYHAALFGVSDRSVLAEAWRKGFVHVGSLTPESAAYIVSYVMKGMTKSDDERLAGRHPEFARMSLRPGLGAGSADTMGGVLIDPSSGEIRCSGQDVPGVFRYHGKDWNIGRYLKGRMRNAAGLDNRAVASAVRLDAALDRMAEYAIDGVENVERRRALVAEKAAQRGERASRETRSKKGI